MSNGFDAYHKWLSIPPHDQPPNHYRLLGLGLFESDPDVVAAAADRQMAHVQTYKTGPHSELSQKLLNEISAAKLCLLRPQKKSAYDEQLRQQLAASPAGFGSLGGAVAAPPTGPLPAGTSPKGTPSIAARMSNPAPFAEVGSGADDGLAARPGAMAGTVAASMSRGMAYPGMSGGPVNPPPPTLPPPVTDAPTKPIVGTMTILIAAGVVAVLLLIGIVVVLNQRNGHASSPSTVEKPDASTPPDSPSSTNASIPSTQPAGTQNPASQDQATQNQANQNTNVVGNPPKTVNPFESSGFTKGDSTQKTDDHGKKPPPASGNDVATTVPLDTHPPDKNHGDKSNPDKANPDKTAPDKTSPDKANPDKTVPKVTPVKAPLDPALAGKAAVPDATAIAAAEQKLGPSTDASAADLLELAHNAAESSEIYVLLRRALDAATKLGDAATAISTVDELVRRFAVNSLEVRLQTLTDLQAHVRTSAAMAAVATAESALIDEATTAAQPDTVQKLAEMSIVAARKSGDADVIRRVTLRIIHIRNPAAPVPTP